ncbi:LCI fold-containing protein [Bacillus atrophaeus]|uniref:LCI fold-containing protein n=1 Tax=Bacillus atrophaeus TaxID=1452 RepID=UPI00288040A0|nr:LCI fold-containing protein [Bacillus atrophaeus]MDS9995361.1 antimicrobial peptide LCI [Bacillus atrophaeus]
MSYGKILTGIALSVGLLVSGSPAFAASTSSNAEKINVASDDFKAQVYTWDITNSTGIFDNTFESDGIQWYLKGITKNSDGTWTAHYEGRRI